MTMSVPAVQRALVRRVRALERDLPAVLGDDVEALHRSRVASRRLREILPVLGLERHSVRQTPIRKLRRRLRRLTSSLGGVRELDVALGILDELRHDHPDLEDVLSRARAAVEAERRECRDEMARQMEDIQAGAMFEQLASLITAAAHSPHATRVALLRRRLERRVERLDDAVRDAGSLFDVDRLHQVRVAAKQLRYVLELIHEFGRVPALRLVNQLKQFQDLLGRLHDLVVVSGYIQRERRTRSRRYSDEIDRATELLEREMRELHAGYLARVDRLARIVSICRTEIDRRLEGTTSPRLREGANHGR
jgi:CHAD domain-containing protein